MTYTTDGDRVVLGMGRDEYAILTLLLGHAADCADPALAGSILQFADRLNPKPAPLHRQSHEVE